MRKIRLDDAKVMNGTLTEEVIASQMALGYAESDSHFLRSMAVSGRISSCLEAQLEVIKEDAFHIATATGAIQRSKDFDYPDLMLDRIIEKFKKGDIPGQVDEFIKGVRGTQSSPGR